MATRRIVFALALGVAGSVGLAQEAPTVAVRDQLTFAVLGVAELSSKCVVAGDGTCVIPYVGPVKVLGLTAREVETALTRILKEKDIHRNPQVTVEFVQVANLRATVSGAVRTQGVQMYSGELTVFDALVRAGGALGEAGDEILLVRRSTRPSPATGGKAAPQDIEDTVVRISRSQLEGGDRAVNVRLQDGDVIIVPKAQQVFVSGYVRSPGPYTIESGITLRQALVLAGGISDRGSDRRIDILRKAADGKEAKVDDVSLSTVVKAGDTIIVKNRIF